MSRKRSPPSPKADPLAPTVPMDSASKEPAHHSRGRFEGRQPKRPVRAPMVARPPAQAEPDSWMPLFCHDCGKRVRPGKRSGAVRCPGCRERRLPPLRDMMHHPRTHQADPPPKVPYMTAEAMLARMMDSVWNVAPKTKSKPGDPVADTPSSRKAMGINSGGRVGQNRSPRWVQASKKWVGWTNPNKKGQYPRDRVKPAQPRRFSPLERARRWAKLDQPSTVSARDWELLRRVEVDRAKVPTLVQPGLRADAIRKALRRARQVTDLSSLSPIR